MFTRLLAKEFFNALIHEGLVFRILVKRSIAAVSPFLLLRTEGASHGPLDGGEDLAGVSRRGGGEDI